MYTVQIITLRKFGLVCVCVCAACVHVCVCTRVWCRQSMTLGHSTFIHDQFSTLICLLYTDFRPHTQLMNEHFRLSHSGALKLNPELYFVSTKCQKGQFQWLCDLRHWSVTIHLLRLRVRILPGAWMSVCCECCVLSGRVLCDGLITCPEESY